VAFSARSPTDLRDPVWLISMCRRIASGLRRPPAVEYDDVVSEAALLIISNSWKYDRAVSQGLQCEFEPWVIITVRGDLQNKYSKEWDYHNRRVAVVDSDVFGDWLDNYRSTADGDARATLRDVLDTAASRLNPAEKEVYLLTLEGFGVPEIARLLNLKVKAVTLRLYRMRVAMRARVPLMDAFAREAEGYPKPEDS